MLRDDTGRWLVGAEAATFVLADLRGLHYLRYLLERPGVEVEALELSNVATGHAGIGLRQADVGEVLDGTALTAYRRRLGEPDAELDAARLLRDSIHTGLVCRYEPNPDHPVTWNTRVD